MKKFIINVALFLLLPLVTIIIIFSKADGYADAFYLRFTSPRQTSLILGTSRAAQGIQPQILNACLSRNDFFNYSFTLGHTRYGPNYFQLIKRKLDTRTKQGIFILTIDPWSISNTGKESDDSLNFKEPGNTETANNYFVNMNPNIYYLLFKYNQPYINLLKPTSRELFLHKDGWLEVNCPMDSASVAKRTNDKIGYYREHNLPNYRFSKLRYDYLVKTISYLKNYGEVYLVRLPVHPLMMNIENELLPDFDNKIKEILKKENIHYFDMTYLNEKCSYTDGNHLYKESGKRITYILAKWIFNQKNKKD